MRSFYRVGWYCLVLLTTGCPADRTAQRTLRGTPNDVPPAMQSPALPAVVVITGLRGPESVLHDPDQDVYFISNVNGGLLERDGDGFISRVDAKTNAVSLKWIESGRNGVVLDAPKGMGIVGDTLHVSDIAGVRKFDRRTGRPLGVIPLPGATLINDIASDGASIYVSDTGLRPGPGVTFVPTGTDAIWKITGDRAERVASTTDLHNPNGLAVVDGKVRFVTFTGGELRELSGATSTVLATLAEGQLDGLVHRGDGAVLIASWEGEGIYRGSADGGFTPILTGIDAPADIAYDATRGRLLVPAGNQVTIHSLR
jgi:hypothetical protein